MNNNNNNTVKRPIVKVVVPNADYIAEKTITNNPQIVTEIKDDNNLIVSESITLGESGSITISPKVESENETEKNDNQSINPWDVPKNLPKYSPDDIKKLSPKDKKNYDVLKKRPSKIGRYIEIRSQQSLYKISIYDFLPFFIGQIYSIVRLFVAYGDAKRTINFNRKLMSDMRGNLVISMAFCFVIWPITIICLFIFYPFMVANTDDYSTSTVTYAWMEISNNGLQGISAYFDKAVLPLFDSERLAITLIVWIGIGMCNVQTLLFYLLFKFGKNELFKMQKNNVRLEVQKVKEKKVAK